eukprot:scaffold1355_cov268-Pinguiococcus_pyrenoidosus.AAC.87
MAASTCALAARKEAGGPSSSGASLLHQEACTTSDARAVSIVVKTASEISGNSRIRGPRDPAVLFRTISRAWATGVAPTRVSSSSDRWFQTSGRIRMSGLYSHTDVSLSAASETAWKSTERRRRPLKAELSRSEILAAKHQRLDAKSIGLLRHVPLEALCFGAGDDVTQSLDPYEGRQLAECPQPPRARHCSRDLEKGDGARVLGCIALGTHWPQLRRVLGVLLLFGILQGLLNQPQARV